jgi:hypothetical protein
LQKIFSNILEFTKLRDKCFFCEGPLRASLTNYINPRDSGSLPVLDATISSGRFSFQVNHTTQSYDIKADGVIDITNNKLVFVLPADSEMPFLDQHVAKQAFVELRPHIQLACNNRKCKYKYALSSWGLDAKRPSDISAWEIQPLKLFYETFRSGNLIVQNDWLIETTYIYSRLNTEADPIRPGFIDFEAMGKEKLLTRIRTLVTFS